MNASRPILCEKCGWFKGTVDDGHQIHICPVCENKMMYVDLDIKLFAHMSSDEAEQYAINYIGHDFNPELKLKRIDYDANRTARIRQQSQKFDAEHPECPYCKSRSTKKISGLSKAGSVALFGIFSISRNSKQWHCNNCGADF